MKLIHDLIEKGFKPFRDGKNGLEPCKNPSWFSSVEPDMLAIMLKRDDKKIVIGLYEMGHPPTLIHPMLGSSNVEIEQRLRELTVEDIIQLS